MGAQTLPWEGLDMTKEKEVVKHKEACKKSAVNPTP
jgi:hypothetical protein